MYLPFSPHRFSFIPCTRQAKRAVQVQQELSSLLKYLLLTIAQLHRSNWARIGQRPARLLVYIYEQRGDKEGADNRTTHHLHLYHRLFTPFLFAPAEFHLFLLFFFSFPFRSPNPVVHSATAKKKNNWMSAWSLFFFSLLSSAIEHTVLPGVVAYWKEKIERPGSRSGR